jgi:hypothetical protein|tara:strand:+ start:421 stop:1035 length:615 start_codon:yes stop_codon:yes gene_type:complete
MYIELLGLSGLKIQTNDTVVLLAPPGKKSEIKSSRMKADIVVLKSPNDEVNIEPRAEKLFTIKNPGEFESSGIFVYCTAQPEKGEPKSLMNLINIEGVTIAHLADLGHQLSDAQHELFEGADVLLVPVGGKDVLDAKAAKQLIEKIEPRVVIPMHAALKGLKTSYDDIEKFWKVIGTTPEPQERIKITKKELPQETMDILHLTP